MAAAKKSLAKKAAKPVAKKAGAPKSAAKKPVKKPVKKPAPRPAAKKAPVAKGKAPAKKSAKPAPSRAAKPSKVVKAPVKAAAPAKKVSAAPVKAAAVPPAKKPQAPRSARSEKAARPPVAAPSGAPIAPLPQVSNAPSSAPAPSPKDLAAAHEYLLARSATRSEEPVMVNGKRLPTEGELLKMAEADYMNEQQLAFFKFRLQQMERELLQNADETTEHLRETVIVPDPADRATIEEEHALELRTRDRERKLLKKVQQALARIDGGDYGFCEETGEPIGIPRLLARPTATLSLEAQQRREMKQKMYGD
jgi:RNA polymerase-binding transcription factor